jgi:carbon-monoxide dehydrogenase small subunit
MQVDPQAQESALTAQVEEQTRTIAVHVNGKLHRSEVRVRWTLADYLRHQLELTGTHVGCEHGVCGACTVLVDGRSARSCLMLAVQVDNRQVTTVEGVAPSPHALHPVQQALHDHHGLQCGFCTPGIVTTLVELLRDNPDPTEAEVRDTLSGNICRCTGYDGIVKAALAAGARLRAEGNRA